MKHLLSMAELSEGDIFGILNLADQLKYEKKHGIVKKPLSGKTLGMIFEKASTRTRVSFEVAMHELGGYALYLNANDLQIGRGEPIEDTARVLSRYLDCIMIRTYKQKTVEDLARFGSIPVINGLSDLEHPCQILADLMTIREYKGSFKGLKLAYIGDGNNVANSLIIGGLKMGMSVAIACPDAYRPAPAVLDFAAAHEGFLMTPDIAATAADADVLYTDVWASMGMESEKSKREKDFSGYQINDEVLKLAKHDAIVLHCLPAHRGEEITAEAFEAHAAEIFDEAENRLHAQKAVLVKLLKH
jgi:ornithine carbamoyltransferase